MIETVQCLDNQRGFLLIKVDSVDCIENFIHHDAEPGESRESRNAVDGGYLARLDGRVPYRDPLLKLFKLVREGHRNERICFLQSRWPAIHKG